MQKLNIKSNHFLLLFIVLGSVVRIAYGLYFKEWLHNPDELAWGMILSLEGSSYETLVFYPHEGGSILIAALAKVASLFTSWNNLFITAVLVDLVVRWLTLLFVKKEFSLKVFLLFGCWSILATPTILPWGTLNYGLHSSSSMFPFILLFLLNSRQSTLKSNMILGAFIGISIWYSYINVILLPALLFYIISYPKQNHTWIYSIIGLLILLTAHFLVRHYNSAGFVLNGYSIDSIRGESLKLDDIQSWKNIFNSTKTLINSIIGYNDYPLLTKVLYYAFTLIALLGTTVYFLKKMWRIRMVKYMFTLLITFLVFYGLSPFYTDSPQGNYITYRHLTYILPLFILFLIVCISEFRYSKILISVFLTALLVNGVMTFTYEKKDQNPLTKKATGWVLAKKLGHKPELIDEAINNYPENDSLYYEGVAWGVTSSLFENLTDSSDAKEKSDKMIDILNQYSATKREYFKKGVKLGFSKKVTPTLDSTIGDQVYKRLDSVWSFVKVESVE